MLDMDEFTLAKGLWIIVAPAIFCIGVTGNVLIVCVMLRRSMRGTSTSAYLCLMAIADSLVLVTGMTNEWLEAMELVVFKTISPLTCKIDKFTVYTVSDTAIWILVIFTIDRLLAVLYPMSALQRTGCKASKVLGFCFLVFFLALCKNVHVFWTRGAEYTTIASTDINESEGQNTSSISLQVLVSVCGSPTAEGKYFELYVRPWIASAVVFLIPFVIILTCNVFIVRALLRVKRTRSRISISSEEGDKTLVQMTAMCLSASFFFLVCITPSIVLLIGRPYWATTSGGEPRESYSIAKAINNQLVYVNHSVNIFLYCLAGQKFRIELAALLTCNSSRRQLYRVNNSSYQRHKSCNGNGNATKAGDAKRTNPDKPKGKKKKSRFFSSKKYKKVCDEIVVCYESTV